MDTEIREWFNEIWAYCEEHWTAVLASAAVVLILLLSIVLIFAAKREDRKALQQQAAAEIAAEPETEEPDAAELEAEAPGTAEEPGEEDSMEEPGDTEPAEIAEEPDADAVSEPEPEAEDFSETALGMVDSLVKSMESAAGASGQKVESIELKIEKAQLTIRYAGDAGKTVTEDLFAEKFPEEAVHAAETEAEPETVHTDFAENAGRPKRFGFDNMNTARSGRVYTEEELLNQIRD